MRRCVNKVSLFPRNEVESGRTMEMELLKLPPLQYVASSSLQSSNSPTALTQLRNPTSSSADSQYGVESDLLVHLFLYQRRPPRLQLLPGTLLSNLRRSTNSMFFICFLFGFRESSNASAEPYLEGCCRVCLVIILWNSAFGPQFDCPSRCDLDFD